MAQLGETLGIKGDLGAGSHHVALFLHDVEEALPDQVAGDALGLLQHDAQFPQWLKDLHAVAVDVLVQPVLVDRVGEVDRGLDITAPYEQEGVLDPEVGVVADSTDDEDVAGAVVGVEVGAVVEVAVRGAGPGDRLGELVDGVFVERAEHGHSSPISRFSRPPW